MKRAQEQIYTLSQERPSQQRQQEEINPALDSTIPSMPRRSVGSAPADVAVHLVDDIEDSTTCELHIKVKNVSIKVVDDYALQIPLTQHSIPVRFQRAMLVSWLMRWWTNIRG